MFILIIIYIIFSIIALTLLLLDHILRKTKYTYIDALYNQNNCIIDIFIILIIYGIYIFCPVYNMYFAISELYSYKIIEENKEEFDLFK